MELKKSYQADLEHGWGKRFLLGLVIAVSLLFAALQYTYLPSDHESDEALLDEIAQDIEMLPAVPMENMAQAPIQTEKKTVSEKINPVDDAVKVEPDETKMPSQEVNLEMPGLSDEKPLVDEATLADSKEQVINFRVVEKLPEFPGGWPAFMKWLTQNLRYPTAAQKQKIQGRVVVAFIVNKDGGISDLRIVQHAHTYLDREAMRVMRLMPKWTAGEDHGEACRTMVAIPVVFSL